MPNYGADHCGQHQVKHEFSRYFHFWLFLDLLKDQQGDNDGRNGDPELLADSGPIN
jgi:hypothetical protein